MQDNFEIYFSFYNHFSSSKPRTEQEYSIKIANESFKNVAKFKYLRTTPTNQNDMHYEIKTRLNSGNTCSHSVQILLSSRLISKNLNITICKTVILTLLLYGCETWSLTLREEYRLGIIENRVLRKIFGPKRKEDGSWRKLHNDELNGCVLHLILLE
jgi:hypothetical protein